MKITKDSLKALLAYITKLTIGYIIVALSVFFALENADLVDAITALKIFSLVVLLSVNGDIARHIDKTQNDIKRINYVILGATSIILIIITVKMIGLDVHKSNMVPALIKPYIYTATFTGFLHCLYLPMGC